MNTNDKIILENFANHVLSINTTVSVQTHGLKSVGYDIDLICRLIAEYNKLSEEERKFIFEKDFVSAVDETSFGISITRK